MVRKLLGRLSLSRPQALRLLVMAGVPVLAVLVGGFFYLSSGRYVSTDNAYVKAGMASISADVSGKVVEVNVRQHEQVRPGQLLLRLDDAPHRFALHTAEAGLEKVERQIVSMRASYQAGRTTLKAVEDNVAYLKRAYERGKKLAQSGITAQEQLDAAEHAFHSARLEAEAKREELKKLLAELGGSPDQPLSSYPSYQEAQALRDQAAWNLERTVVRAPVAGTVGQEPPVVGDYVRVGTPIFALVGARPWVEANLKETDLPNISVGEPATFTVDAFPGHTWTARVASISPATGAEFSLLPPQNATGNWVKVVQRVPVRLDIGEAPGLPELQSGLSVSVEIDTGQPSALTGMWEKALVWSRGRP